MKRNQERKAKAKDEWNKTAEEGLAPDPRLLSRWTGRWLAYAHGHMYDKTGRMKDEKVGVGPSTVPEAPLRIHEPGRGSPEPKMEPMPRPQQLSDAGGTYQPSKHAHHPIGTGVLVQFSTSA